MVPASFHGEGAIVTDDLLDDFLQKLHLKLIELSNDIGKLKRAMASAENWIASQGVLDETIANLGRKLAYLRSSLSGQSAAPQPSHADPAASTLDAVQRDAIRSAQSALEMWHAALILMEEAYYWALVAWSTKRRLDEHRSHPHQG